MIYDRKITFYYCCVYCCNILWLPRVVLQVEYAQRKHVEDVVSWFDLRNRQVYEAVPAKRNWLLYAVNIAVIVVILLLFYAKRSRKS
jgi:hypothetical protein